MEELNIHTYEPHIYLPINLGTELLVEIVDLKLRTKSRLIGMECSKFMIMKLSPKELGGVDLKSLMTSPLIIRYLYKGSVYGFKTEVLNVIRDPASLVFVRYPTKIEECNVRNNPRFECILPAKIKIGPEIMEMVIVDISQDGCRSIVKIKNQKNAGIYNSIEMDKVIEIKMQVPGVEDKLGVMGMVRNINKEDDRVVLGVKFEQMSPEVKANLINFISLIAEIEKKPS